MCGRFALHADAGTLRQVLGLAALPDAPPRYNLAPTQDILAVRVQDGQHLALPHRWGLIPSWAKDSSIGANLINARSETANEKPAFRSAFRSRRCLIPASGFFEWKSPPPGVRGPKTPFYLKPRIAPIFVLAGLWESWTAPGDQLVHSCTILTTQPNDLVRGIHDRMPVILPPEAFGAWLDPRNHDVGFLAGLLRPWPATLMEAFPVGAAVGNVASQGAGLIAPVPAEI